MCTPYTRRYIVQCTIFTTQCTLFVIYTTRIMFIIYCKKVPMYFIIERTLHTSYNIRCIAYFVRRAIHIHTNVQCTLYMYGVQCTCLEYIYIYTNNIYLLHYCVCMHVWVCLCVYVGVGKYPTQCVYMDVCVWLLCAERERSAFVEAIGFKAYTITRWITKDLVSGFVNLAHCQAIR